MNVLERVQGLTFFHPLLTLSVKVLFLCPDPFVSLITQSDSCYKVLSDISIFSAFFFLQECPCVISLSLF